VALGFWNDATGRREVLDWEITTSRSAHGMGNVAQPFMARGLRQENGLQMVVLDGSYQQGVGMQPSPYPHYKERPFFPRLQRQSFLARICDRMKSV
jgi:hypothetical protein